MSRGKIYTIVGVTKTKSFLKCEDECMKMSLWAMGKCVVTQEIEKVIH